jgi:hypothetical protein
VFNEDCISAWFGLALSLLPFSRCPRDACAHPSLGGNSNALPPTLPSLHTAPRLPGPTRDHRELTSICQFGTLDYDESGHLRVKAAVEAFYHSAAWKACRWPRGLSRMHAKSFGTSTVRSSRRKRTAAVSCIRDTLFPCLLKRKRASRVVNASSTTVRSAAITSRREPSPSDGE